MPGHQDDRHQRIPIANCLDQFQTVHLRHLQIADNQIGQPLLDQLERRDSVFGILQSQRGVLFQKPTRQAPIERRVVADHRYAELVVRRVCRLCAHGVARREALKARRVVERFGRLAVREHSPELVTSARPQRSEEGPEQAIEADFEQELRLRPGEHQEAREMQHG